jgi:hypothetical protein
MQSISEITNILSADLLLAKELVYDKCGLAMSNAKLHSESKEYGACSFILNELNIEHRVSKITPTKAGQFVTIWKRNKQGITAPFDISDKMDLIIITSKSGNNSGQFIFPKQVLAAKGIVSQNGREGKRGIRVYPPWDIVTSKQALQTQCWQTKYFFTINKNDLPNVQLAKELFMNFNDRGALGQ